MQAQTENYLIYKEYKPNGWDTLVVNQYHYVDINDDGITEFQYETFDAGSGSVTIGSGVYATNGWKACCHRFSEAPGYPHVFFDLSIPLNDISLEWDVQCLAERYGVLPLPYKVGLRYEAEDAYYYGWAEFEEDRDGADKGLFHLSKTCFCAIPNYPLKWGQTSLCDEVEEKEEASFAIVFPNPCADRVTVLGANLKQAEVFNVLGQRITTVKNDTMQMVIDLSDQPAGVYLVSITDSEGKNHIRKVVKK